MSDQPEALRLADRLEGRWALHPEMQEAAAELRRQHDEIERLRVEAEGLRWAYNTVTDDCRNLTEKVIPNIRAERDAAVKLANAASLRMQHDYRCESDHGRFKARCDCGVEQLRAEITTTDAARGEK